MKKLSERKLSKLVTLLLLCIMTVWMFTGCSSTKEEDATGDADNEHTGNNTRFGHYG